MPNNEIPPSDALSGWIAYINDVKYVDIHLSLGDVLLLFVLARIFRQGAEMRAELEGTV